MNKKAIKFLLVAILFFAALSLGNKNKSVQKKATVDDVEGNLFMRIGHKGEEIVSDCFEFVIDSTGKIISVIFGI